MNDRITALEEALEFYADQSAWSQPPVKTRDGLLSVEYENQASKMQRDRGDIARAALAASRAAPDCHQPDLVTAAQVRVKPLDVSYILRHAFLAGFVAARNIPGWEECNGIEHWLEFDPTNNPAYHRILAALDLTPAPAVDHWHPDDLAVDSFSAHMKAKLAKKCSEGRGGWNGPECDADTLSRMLREHVEKGDPLDVGNLAMMLHQRGERISAPAVEPVEMTAQDAARDHVGQARLLVDTGASLMGETLDYPPSVILNVLDHLDAALRAIGGDA